MATQTINYIPSKDKPKRPGLIFTQACFADFRIGDRCFSGVQSTDCILNGVLFWLQNPGKILDTQRRFSSMITRFQGSDGRPRLIAALRRQIIIKDDEILASEIASAAELLQLEACAPLILQDAVDNDIYFIIAGHFSIRVNGREVACRTAGAHVGEMALIDPTAKRSASVIAVERSVVARISETDFSKLAAKYPGLWRRLALELADRLRQRAKFHMPPNVKPNIFIGSGRVVLQ